MVGIQIGMPLREVFEMRGIEGKAKWRIHAAREASVEVRFVVLAVAAMICSAPASALSASAPADEDNASVLALVREATTAVRTNLRTGRAKGRFRLWFGDDELVQSARFTGAFDGLKHYLKLVYEPLGRPAVPVECDKRIVVCDGSELFVSRFSEAIQPDGAEADIYPEGRRSERAAMKGFPADLKLLAAGVLKSEVLDKHTVEVEKLANGHFLGRYEVTPNSYDTFEIAPEYGYQCILRESFVRSQLAYRWTVGWQCVGDLWHAASGRMERYKDGKQSEAYEWQFDEFEANVPVSPQLFTLSALELPGGARMLDRRRPEGMPVFTDSGKPKPFETEIYRLKDTEGKLEQQRAERLIEQVQAMSVSNEIKEPTSAWGSRIWGVAIGVLGIVAIGIVWFISKRTTG
ncbi:MAG: hypothetical protein HQ582_25150 [Planctomycetes bacterium]|nr:hypothetical protein [Planctomycetota bacterium]